MHGRVWSLRQLPVTDTSLKSLSRHVRVAVDIIAQLHIGVRPFYMSVALA